MIIDTFDDKYTMRTNLLHWCNLVAISKNVVILRLFGCKNLLNMYLVNLGTFTKYLVNLRTITKYLVTFTKYLVKFTKYQSVGLYT